MTKIEPRKKPGLSIFLAGIISSAICLIIVHFVNKSGFEIMGFYLWYFVPVGALLVGLASGLGYGIGSWASNVRVSKVMLLIIFCLSLMTYFAAEYITYVNVLEENKIHRDSLSFVQYLRITTESMTYRSLEKNDDKDFELGKWGYLLRAFDILGFCFGAIISSLILRQSAYCSTCQLYMKKSGSFYIISSTQRDALKKKNKKEREAIIVESIKEVSHYNDQFLSLIEGKGFPETLAVMQGLVKNTPKDAIAFIQYDLAKCSRCNNHHIKVTLQNVTVNKQNNMKILAKLSREIAEV
jgi:hypothetical protein